VNARNSSWTAEDLQSGERELRLALEGLRSRLNTHEEGLFESLEKGLTHPLARAFSQALEAHQRLLEETGLGGIGANPRPVSPERAGETASEPVQGPSNEAPRNPALEGDRLRRYRAGVRTQVLEPLRKALGEMEVGGAMAGRWVGFLHGLPGLTDELPEEILRPEPQDLYGPLARDGRITALRKSLVRGRRSVGSTFAGMGRAALRLFRRQVPPPRPRAQRVPLRTLARECHLRHCPLALDPLAEALQQHYSGHLARLEAAVALWTDEWFSTEESVRRAEGHLGIRFLEELFGATPPPSSAEAPSGDPDTSATEGPREDEAEDPVREEVDAGETLQTELDGLMEICRELSDALAAGASLGSPSHVRNRMGEIMEGEWDNLMERIRVAGSFQEVVSGEKAQRRTTRRLERGRARAAAWEKWHRKALERLQLAILILRLREGFDEAESQLMGRIVGEGLSLLGESLKETRAGILALRSQAEAQLALQPDPMDPELLAQAVEELREQARALLESGLDPFTHPSEAERLIRRAADDVAARLSDSLRFLPESISVPSLQDDEARVVPTVSIRHIPFREMVLQTMDALRLEAIRNSPQPLLDFLATGSAEASELPNIVSYNLTAAAEELRTSPAGPVDPVIEDARSLTTDGLARTSQGIYGLLEGLGGSWREFTQEAHDLLLGSFDEIHRRAVAEGAVQEQMLGLHALSRQWARQGITWLSKRFDWLQQRASATLKRGWIRGARLVRLGRSAVGQTVTRDGAAERASEVLLGLPQLLDSLPLVYKRLFSAQPVTDPNLLVGREEELAWINRRLEAWRAGLALPSLLTGHIGVGHTSLLNTLESETLREFRTFRLALDRRIRSEKELATLLARTLGLGEDAPWTLPGVGRRILDPRVFPEPFVLLIEHVEHLFLRIPGGTNLLEDFFSLQAQTASRVFWISTTSGATWKILQKNEPNAVNLLNPYPIPALTREATEQVIMTRHRRSGLPVEFMQPGDLNPLIRRKVRLSRGEKAKQQILRGEYFDRLHRLSEGSIAMSIFLWLRSTDFSSREGWLRVHAPRSIDFPFLDVMDLTLAFALKAFLDHGSLTLEEYGEVFGTSREEAYQVLEALRSRALLQPIESAGSVPRSREAVTEAQRYRIPSVLSQVVSIRLRNRNILH